jgi:hypothetical protein
VHRPLIRDHQTCRELLRGSAPELAARKGRLIIRIDSSDCRSPGRCV